MIRAAAMALAMTASCQATGPGPGPQPITLEPSPARLTAGEPAVRLPIPAGSLERKPSTLQLQLVAISGPSPQGFTLQASLVGDGGERSLIGHVSPYPVDQPGTFMLPLPAETVSAAARWTGAAVEVQLQPAVAGAQLPQEVTVQAQLSGWGA